MRDEIQRIALGFSYYGSRRVTRELHERGRGVNRKKVQRLMREDNLLCLRKRRRTKAMPGMRGAEHAM